MAFRTTSVRNTPELQRVLSLPRRELRKAIAAKQAAALTEELATRSGRGRGAALRPWQGALLHEARKVGGAFASLPVGQGKTLPCELLPVVLESRRAMLILPASLRNKTTADRRSFAGTWRTASPPPRMTSIQELSVETGEYLLERVNPDLIIIDEADELSNWSSGAVRKLDRFIMRKRKAHGFGAVRVVAMTGTPTRKSILGYWHLLRWCLGDMAPVPAVRSEAEEWAAALDAGSPRSGFRPRPGPLGKTLEQARAWYLDRLEHTPGVLLVDEDSAAGIPLTIGFAVAPEDDAIDGAFDVLRTRWESPSGEPVTDPLSLLRIGGQLGSGYYTYWKPPPPEDWIAARRELAAFIRKRVAETRHALKPLDTDAQVIRRHADHPAVVEWKRVKHKFDAQKSGRVRWLSDATLQWCARWLRKHQRAGRVAVVWCGGVEFGLRLAELAGLPYYGREGVDPKTGRELHAADPKRSMVCSWHANKRGFNLQDWRRHAIVQPPPSAKYLEQIFGRAHRSPKEGVALHRTPVRFTVLLTSGGTVDGFWAAVQEAHFAKNTAKNTQKILRAKIKALPALPDGRRWVIKKAED